MLTVVFLLIAAISIACFHLGTGSNKAFLLILVWCGILSAVSAAGFFSNHPKLFLSVIAASIALTIYSYRQTKLSTINNTYLLALHIMRLPVELVLYQLFLQGIIPGIMTFRGWNFDILTGISAIPITLYQVISSKGLSKTFLLLWNITGILLLCVIVCIAFLSAPLPFQQFGFDQPNIALMKFPYSLLPGVIVPLVLLSHLLMIRQTITIKDTALLA